MKGYAENLGTVYMSIRVWVRIEEMCMHVRNICNRNFQIMFIPNDVINTGSFIH